MGVADIMDINDFIIGVGQANYAIACELDAVELE